MTNKKKKIESLPKYEAWLYESLQKQGEAKLYLQAALEDYQIEGDIGCLLLAIRDVAKAQGGIKMLAQKTSLSRESLYKALSNTGNPQFATIWVILQALGFHFIIEPLDKAA